MVRLTYALRPDGIEWPRREDGAPSFKLEHLAAANGLEQQRAHDAVSDVRATIALAAAKDPVGVTVGGCLGHCMCTGMAVAGGRMLASRISEKTVSFWGGCIFLVFGVHSLFFES